MPEIDRHNIFPARRARDRASLNVDGVMGFQHAALTHSASCWVPQQLQENAKESGAMKIWLDRTLNCVMRVSCVADHSHHMCQC